MAMCKVSSTVHFVTRSASGGREGNRAHWVPNTDVYTTDNGLVIKVELAGMRREDLELTVEGNRLMISGQRPDGTRGAKCKFLVMEINYGSFECVIEIPAGYDARDAKAGYQNGFLQIDVPRAVHAPKTKLVPVSGEK